MKLKFLKIIVCFALASCVNGEADNIDNTNLLNIYKLSKAELTKFMVKNFVSNNDKVLAYREHVERFYHPAALDFFDENADEVDKHFSPCGIFNQQNCLETPVIYKVDIVSSTFKCLIVSEDKPNVLNKKYFSFYLLGNKWVMGDVNSLHYGVVDLDELKEVGVVVPDIGCSQKPSN